MPDRPSHSPWSARLAVLASTLLTAVYLLVGDRTAWGECFTVWPPVLWWLLLLPVSLHPLLIGRRRAFVVALFLAVLFVVATTEWWSLVRREDAGLRARFEHSRARPPAEAEPIA